MKSKFCRSLKAAERFQNYLYGRFNIVRLVRAPLFAEEGIYMWEVA
jgi:hypothetical protein